MIFQSASYDYFYEYIEEGRKEWAGKPTSTGIYKRNKPPAGAQMMAALVVCHKVIQ